MTNEGAILYVIRRLNERAVPYVLVGSYSSRFYGSRRKPIDADFVLKLGEIPIDQLRRWWEPVIKITPCMFVEVVSHTDRHLAKVVGSELKIELFIFNEVDVHNCERFRRRRLVSMWGCPIWLPAVEDILITKLRWWGEFRMDQQRSDISDVIDVQSDRIDWDYVHRWCDFHGTRDLLDEIRGS